MSSSFLLDPYIINLVQRGDSVLDVGCGRGKWGYLINTSHKPASFMVGVDVWGPEVGFVSKKGVYGGVVVCDIRFLPLRESCFETVLACEVIEHMEKEDGEFLLKELERVCCGKIIVSTPNIEFEQGEVDGNPYQIHRSQWSTKELTQFGYRVHGVGFGLFGKRTPAFMIMGFSALTYFFPWFSYLLLAVKKVP